MINATMCFLRKNNKTLFINRNAGEGDRHQGYYLPPGGRFERNERGIDCIVREFKEETGLTLINPKLKILATFYNEGRELGGEKNPNDWQVEVYSSQNAKGRLRSEHEGAQPIWVPQSKINGISLYPGDRLIMGYLDLPGIYQTIAEYCGKRLIRFDSVRVD